MDDRSGNIHRRIMVLADRHAAAYRLALVLFGSIGYVYLAATVLLVGAVASGLALLLVETGVGPLALRVSLPFALLTLLLVSALRTPGGPSAALFVARRDAFPLYSLVESVRARVRAPHIHRIHLGTGFEISVVREPRLGSILGFRTHLVLGLPLMLAMPLREYRALLTHELAHYSRTRCVDGVRIYRLRDRWLQLADALAAGRHPAGVLMRAFFRWYAVRFAAFSFAHARRHEAAADRFAAAVTRREELARALLHRGVVERYLSERFYPQLLADLRNFGVIPSGLRARFLRGIRGIPDDRRFSAWLVGPGSVDGVTDTHAHISERLAALGLPESWAWGSADPEVVFGALKEGDSAARQCLGSVRSEVLHSIEHAWIEEVLQRWADRHEELQRWDERRQELDIRKDLSSGETLDLAIATSAIEGTDAALPVLRDLLARRPDMAPASFVLGTLLLRRNDAEGLRHIRKALAANPGLAADGCRFVRDFRNVNPGNPEASGILAEFEPVGEAAPVHQDVRPNLFGPRETAGYTPERVTPAADSGGGDAVGSDTGRDTVGPDGRADTLDANAARFADPDRRADAAGPDAGKDTVDTNGAEKTAVANGGADTTDPAGATKAAEEDLVRGGPSGSEVADSDAASRPPLMAPPGGGYGPHGLDYTDVLAVKRRVAPVAAVARAFLVRETGTTPALPAGTVSMPVRQAEGAASGGNSRFVLAIELMRGDHDPRVVAARLAAELRLPGPGVVVVLSRRHRKLKRSVAGIGSGPLFQRTRRKAA